MVLERACFKRAIQKLWDMSGWWTGIAAGGARFTSACIAFEREEDILVRVRLQDGISRWSFLRSFQQFFAVASAISSRF